MDGQTPILLPVAMSVRLSLDGRCHSRCAIETIEEELLEEEDNMLNNKQ